ncbi:MAG: hemin uptake protein HemP [Cypionkella sp.]
MNAMNSSHIPNDATLPSYDAVHLTLGGAQALIVLAEQTYTLRITRSGKLILTK